MVEVPVPRLEGRPDALNLGSIVGLNGILSDQLMKQPCKACSFGTAKDI